MKTRIGAFCVILILFLYSNTFAAQLEITIEGYPPATLPTATSVINLPDPNDQLEISRQAALLALSPEGWNLGSLGGFLVLNEPPDWSGSFYRVGVPETPTVISLFGYQRDQSALRDPNLYLYFQPIPLNPPF